MTVFLTLIAVCVLALLVLAYVPADERQVVNVTRRRWQERNDAP